MTSEDIEFILMQEYPGLHEIDYQGLGEEFGHDIDMARAEAARAHLMMKAAKMKQRSVKFLVPDPIEEKIWVS